MPTKYIVAMGGTGARCAEAAVYLAAAGLLVGDGEEIHLLTIDPDENNGNGSDFQKLITRYQNLHCMGAKNLFNVAINGKTIEDREPCSCRILGHSGQTFSKASQYELIPENNHAGDFIKLFFSSKPQKEREGAPSADPDMEMELKDGYQGRTHLGAVLFTQDLNKAADEEVPDPAFDVFIRSLQSDPTSTKLIFVFGSVFGGTGATGLPNLPKRVDELVDQRGKTEGTNNAELSGKLQYGCAMMTPYFSYPKKRGFPDSTDHMPATQAVLLHYADEVPHYKHIYLVGAPEQKPTNDENCVGGENQKNKPHYVELISALAAANFFKRGGMDGDETVQLHFADSVDPGTQKDLGVCWETLPSSDEEAREEIRRRLVAFATTLYFYVHFLWEPFVNKHEYTKMHWFKNNPGAKDLDREDQELNQFGEFAKSFFTWLVLMGETTEGGHLRLFNLEAFEQEKNSDFYAQKLGNLIAPSRGERARSGNAPKYSRNAYDKLLHKLNMESTQEQGWSSPTGLFIHLLYEASLKFCWENYHWK